MVIEKRGEKKGLSLRKIFDFKKKKKKKNKKKKKQLLFPLRHCGCFSAANTKKKRKKNCTENEKSENLVKKKRKKKSRVFMALHSSRSSTQKAFSLFYMVY